jgi:hypothetical protein
MERMFSEKVKSKENFESVAIHLNIHEVLMPKIKEKLMLMRKFIF